MLVSVSPPSVPAGGFSLGHGTCFPSSVQFWLRCNGSPKAILG